MSEIDSENCSDNATLPAAEVLRRTARELRDLTTTADQLQVALSSIITESSEQTSNQIYELQRLDYLKQSVDEISNFLQRLASDTPGDWKYDAIAAVDEIKLTALATRLSKTDETTVNGDGLDDVGKCDLFL